MRFQVLGPLEVSGTTGPVHVTGRRRRALLAALLVHCGRVVTIPALIDGVWADEPPNSAVFNIRTYVYSLRRLLRQAGDQPGRLSSHPAGYRLAVQRDEFDLLQFRYLAARGHQAMKDGDHRAAAEHLGAATGLWRGRVLEDLTDLGSGVQATVVALEEERWAVASAWVEARLALGHHEQLIPLLRQMVAERPLYERTRLQLMTALHLAGRTADALAAYREARQVAVAELGVEPGPELQRLHAAIQRGEAIRPPSGALSLPTPPGAGRARVNGRASARGGVAAHARLNGAPEPRPVLGGRGRVPRALPPKPVLMIGRQSVRRRLSRIGQAVSARSPGNAHVGVVVISGPPGVGKTALAVAAAHDLRPRFPDGQLFLSLDGSGEAPRSPATVLAEMLHALGVAEEAVPAGLAERTVLFRSLVADRAMLLVFDDVGTAETLRFLLPGAGRCLALVTSRPQLLELDVAWRCNLGPLAPAEALQLLAAVAGAERVMASVDDAVRVVDACERLPLALRIAGLRLSTSPGLSLAAFAARLADERTRLDELVAGDVSVRSRLSQSYRALDPVARELLLALSQRSAEPITESTAQEVLGVPRPHASRAMDSLVRHNVVIPVSGGGKVQQYTMSALMRIHAMECIESRGE